MNLFLIFKTLHCAKSLHFLLLHFGSLGFKGMLRFLRMEKISCELRNSAQFFLGFPYTVSVLEFVLALVGVRLYARPLQRVGLFWCYSFLPFAFSWSPFLDSKKMYHQKLSYVRSFSPCVYTKDTREVGSLMNCA